METYGHLRNLAYAALGQIKSTNRYYLLINIGQQLFILFELYRALYATQMI